MKQNSAALLERGKLCDSCGNMMGASAYTSSGPSGGIYCSVSCVKQGPVRVRNFESAVRAELTRRGVRFLPMQVVRALLLVLKRDASHKDR